ncbi:MAG: TlyA family RNA methyltransferase [Mycoplasma sp.]|nr:TlyA family RNA methyltransferase [Mycoplasma sp.]
MTLIKLLINKGYGLDESKKLIRAGYVKVDGEEIIIPDTKIRENAEIIIKETKKWVSRGALKLLEAIKFFNINFKDCVVLDIGSSTGGFTEVALKYGAKKVYSLDVGTNQLDFSLRRQEKVCSLEKTNLKTIKKEMFEDKIEIVVTDVSFISLKEVFKVLKNTLEKKIKVVALIKPQYEAFPDQVLKGGIVKKELHKNIIEKVIKHAENFNFKLIDYKESPIKGKKSKNIEYISLFEKE